MAARAAEVLNLQVDAPNLSKRLRTRMRQLPMRLRSSGLAATFAFIDARCGGGDTIAQAYTQLRGAIISHIGERALLGELAPDATPEEFLRELAMADTAAHSRITAEIDLLARWLSRIADARFGALARSSQNGQNEQAGHGGQGGAAGDTDEPQEEQT
ncbi:hypothetical protein GCM10022402_11170 [Salinactinospora qingdaonensis]|uniref:CRISPR type III-B/RAMP module-associated protein Cmr5 n=2 Tax=Salinactinospora qingdaonensis TaxID=702744 RepID=A0ABP7F851_9ACTN